MPDNASSARCWTALARAQLGPYGSAVTPINVYRE
jgi:hypothetical protein